MQTDLQDLFLCWIFITNGEKNVLLPHLQKRVFTEVYFIVSSAFTKEKEVFMTSTEYSWKPSVSIA
jgi:hypothetical protein